MRRTFKFRAYPTRPQEGRAVRLLHDHCDLYNAALQERRDAWRMCQVLVGYRDQSAQLREIRAADPDGQGRHSFTAQQQTLRRLDRAFRAFFRRVKSKGRKAGFPRFKPYQRFDEVLFVVGDGARWKPADAGRWAEASFQAVGRVKVNQHRPVRGQVKTLQLKREYRRWYISIDCHVCGCRCTRPRQDTVICPNCGEQDADCNGARNTASRAGLGSVQTLAV